MTVNKHAGRARESSECDGAVDIVLVVCFIKCLTKCLLTLPLLNTFGSLVTLVACVSNLPGSVQNPPSCQLLTQTCSGYCVVLVL